MNLQNDNQHPVDEIHETLPDTNSEQQTCRNDDVISEGKKASRFYKKFVVSLLVVVCILFVPWVLSNVTNNSNGAGETVEETEMPQVFTQEDIWFGEVLKISSVCDLDLNDVDHVVFSRKDSNRGYIEAPRYEREAVYDLSAAQDGSVCLYVLRDSEPSFDQDGFTTYEIYLEVVCDEKIAVGASTSNLFSDFTTIRSISFNNMLDTSSVTDMSHMFDGLQQLENLDFSGFDTAKVEDMSNMFYNCESLNGLDLSNFNTRNVRDMNHMFSGCKGLNGLDVYMFNTANVTDMSYMFYGCKNLESLNLSAFDTTMVEDMTCMLFGCAGLHNGIVIGDYFENLVDYNVKLAQWETDSLRYYSAFMDEGVPYDGAPWEFIFLHDDEKDAFNSLDYGYPCRYEMMD